MTTIPGTSLHQELYDYWVVKKRERPMPARADIDPAEIKKLLPHLLLTDVVEGGKRFRYRLVGTSIAETFGGNISGHHVDEVMTGKYLNFIEGVYRDIVQQRKPIYSESMYNTGPTVGMKAERLMLPLSSDGEAVDMVLSLQTMSFASPVPTTTIRLAQERNEEMQHLSKLLD
jgi:hypothetical protein